MSESNLLNVIVADDEFYARKALIKILREADPDIRILAETCSGEEATQVLKTSRDPVHIVVTDIRMPGAIDGLELARYISEHAPHTRAILVSGYADFTYAQQAITYGVKDYLLKPVQKNQLCETIARIKQEFYAETQQKNRTDSPFGVYEQFSLKELMQNENLLHLLPELYSKLNSDLPYLLYLMQTEPSYTENTQNIFSALQQELDPQWAVPLYFRGNDEFLVFLFLQDNQDEESAIVQLKYLFHRISHEFPSLSFSAGVSLLHHKSADMGRSYRECVCAINRRLLSGWNQLYRYETMPVGQAILTSDIEEGLLQTLCEKNAEKASAIIGRLFKDPQLLRSGNSSTLHSLTLGILNVTAKAYRMQEWKADANSADVSLIFSQRYDLYTLHHLSDLQEYLLRIVHSLCASGHSGETSSGEAIVHEILAYIDRNYRTDISLYELATEKYFMNPSYLSRLFKSVSGVPFSKYIIDVRMKKARSLLENSPLKVSDIAFHVGYNNPSHFINSFRKTYGVTPEEYRSRVRKGITSKEISADL